MDIVAKLCHYTPYDGDIGLRADRWKRAVKRLCRHKSLRRAQYPWNVAAHHLRWRLTEPERIRAWVDQRLHLEGGYWLFIAGCNNSGTTLLREVLRTHPEICALPREGAILTEALPRPTSLGVPRLFATRMQDFRWTEEDDPSPALRAKYDWSRYVEGPGRILLEKSPEDTVRTRWLQKNFAPARFLGLVRAPYAVCEGTRRRSGHSIAEAARHWTAVNACLLEDLPHLHHHLLLRYEDFCASPQEHLKRIRRFLELQAPFGSQALKSQDVHNCDQQASDVRDFNAKSLERLTAHEIAEISRIAGPVMQKLGYEPL